MRKVFFKKIGFLDIKNFELEEILKKNGLYVFPSAPGLASINEKYKYYHALKKADFVFFDSGLFVLLLRFLKNLKVNKLSGFKFVKFLLNYIQKKPNIKVFLIDPNLNFSKNNKKLIISKGIVNKNMKSYIAPRYDPKNITDPHLINKLNFFKPELILLNIGGGTQEILGLYIKERIKFKSKIICTGAAISFFTGDQAPVNDFFDRFYLGWFVRLIFDPKLYYKRYLYALKLFKIVLLNEARIK